MCTSCLGMLQVSDFSSTSQSVDGVIYAVQSALCSGPKVASLDSCGCMSRADLDDMRVTKVAVVDDLTLNVLGDGTWASGNELDGNLQHILRWSSASVP